MWKEGGKAVRRYGGTAVRRYGDKVVQGMAWQVT
jgi:hypothetical protein